jgi:hypothetical protein
VQLVVGDQSVGDLVDGRAADVIQSNSRDVARSAFSGQASSVARRETAAMLLRPNFRTN